MIGKGAKKMLLKNRTFRVILLSLRIVQLRVRNINKDPLIFLYHSLY